MCIVKSSKLRAPNKVLKYDFGVRCSGDTTTYYREYMREYNKEKINCGCGRTLRKSVYKKHLETKYHKKRAE